MRSSPSTSAVSLASARVLSLLRALARPFWNRFMARGRDAVAEAARTCPTRRAVCTRDRGCPFRRTRASRRGIARAAASTIRRADLVVEPTGPRRDLEARDQSLHVPLPRARQRLVEVVDVEHDRAVRCREPAEVRQVRVATALDPEPRLRTSSRGRPP